MIALPLAHYRFQFRAEEQVTLPEFAGSTWRGAFGTALRRTLCATRLKQCDACPLLNSCAFPYLFEGRRPQEVKALTSFERVAVPYALRPAAGRRQHLARGDGASLDLALFGRANDKLIYVVHALAAAAEKGVGPGRGRLSLQRAVRLLSLAGEEGGTIYSNGRFQQPVPPESPSCKFAGRDALDIALQTPLRLKVSGRLVTPEGLTASHFIDAAVRRVSALATFHAGGPIDADFPLLKRLAAEVSLREARLVWSDWKRYSSRQAQRMAMGGMTGRFKLHFPEEARGLIPWLELGQWAGIGKAATMGLGQFVIDPEGETIA